MTAPDPARLEQLGQLEHELRVAEARFAGIVGIAADAIISIDAEQRITLFNEGAERIFGWPASEIIGQPLDVLLPERFRATHSGHVQEFGDSSEPARRMGHRRAISGLHRDGREFPAEASISRYDVDGQRIYNVVLRDITERRRIEDDHRFLADIGEVLGASLNPDLMVRGAVRLAVPTLGDACVLKVHDGSTWQWGAAAHTDPDRERLLAQLRQREPTALIPPHPGAQALRELTPVHVQVTDELLRQLARDDAHLALLRQLGAEWYLYVPMVVGGEPAGLLRLERAGRRFEREDVALAEEFARRLALALDNARLYERAHQAVRARDETISVVSHDLRNPVAAVKMLAMGLLRARPSPEELTESLHTIAEAAGQCDRLIQDLLDVSRIEAGRLAVDPDPVDLAGLLGAAREMLAPLAADRGLTLEIVVPDGLPLVLADVPRVQQVLSNLVGNALKFTRTGGVVLQVEVPAPDARELVVAVADTGPGIPAEHLPRLFDRFWQGGAEARRAGAGLGLPIARGIVDAHGGQLHVESVPGRGSTFRFTLPVAPDA